MFTIYQRTNYATEDPITSEKLKVLNNEKAKQQFAEMHWGETSDPGPDKFEVIRLHIAMIELLERFGFKQKYFQMARLKEQQRVHGSIMTWVSIFVLMEGLSRRYAAISKVLSEINKDVRPHLNLDHAQKLMVETNNHLKLADRFISGKRKGRESRLSYTVSSNWDRVLFGLARLITQLEKLKWLDDVPKKPGIPPKRWRSA
jgi:hypothetical protein